MNRLEQKLARFVQFGRELAELSTCKAARCGAVAFTLDFSGVYGIGYNGPPVGQSNDSCSAPDLAEGELARCGCIHAEANLCQRIDWRPEPLIVFSTTMPCPHCAGLIANKRRIVAVLWDRPYRTNAGAKVLVDAGIEISGPGYYDYPMTFHAIVERIARKGDAR